MKTYEEIEESRQHRGCENPSVDVPERSQKRGVNGVSVIHVEMVPAALGGKMVET